VLGNAQRAQARAGSGGWPPFRSRIARQSRLAYDDSKSTGQEDIRVIRLRKPRDDEGILRLVRNELVPNSSLQMPDESGLREDIHQRLRRGTTLVAASGRKSPIAFLHMEFRDRTLFVDLLAVDASEQNRHWGSLLMAKAEQLGREKGCREARLYVDERNYRAQRFYQRLGYLPVQYVQSLRCYELVKPLVETPHAVRIRGRSGRT